MVNHEPRHRPSLSAKGCSGGRKSCSSECEASNNQHNPSFEHRDRGTNADDPAQGTTVRDATQAEMSYGPRSTDTSDWSRIRAHTRERIGENAICTSAAFDEGATVQAAHCVAAAIVEGTTALDDEARTSRFHPFCGSLRTFVNAGARQLLVLPLLFRRWVLLFRGSLFHTRECFGEYASLGFASVHVDTFLSDTSSRAHLSVAAPVFIGDSPGQRNVGVSDFRAHTLGRCSETADASHPSRERYHHPCWRAERIELWKSW